MQLDALPDDQYSVVAYLQSNSLIKIAEAFGRCREKAGGKHLLLNQDLRILESKEG